MIYFYKNKEITGFYLWLDITLSLREILLYLSGKEKLSHVLISWKVHERFSPDAENFPTLRENLPKLDQIEKFLSVE